MAILLADFRVLHPEFAKVPDNLVQGELDSALRQLNELVWLDLLNDGQRYLAAHQLALSPFGTNARMVMKDGQGTTYLVNYKRLLSLVSEGAQLL